MQVGNQHFIEFAPGLSPPGQTLEEITRSGVDGVAFRKKGKRGVATQHRTRAVVTSAAALKTLEAQYKAMQGSVVSVTINGNTYANYLVREVGQFDHQEVASMVGGVLSNGSAVSPGLAGWHLLATWTFIYAGL